MSKNKSFDQLTKAEKILFYDRLHQRNMKADPRYRPAPKRRWPFYLTISILAVVTVLIVKGAR